MRYVDGDRFVVKRPAVTLELGGEPDKEAPVELFGPPTPATAATSCMRVNTFKFGESRQTDGSPVNECLRCHASSSPRVRRTLDSTYDREECRGGVPSRRAACVLLPRSTDDQREVIAMTFIPRNMAPFERYPDELATSRINLAQLGRHHVPLMTRVIGAGGALYMMDLWLLGVAQRSFHLVEGFLQVFDSWNITVAAPIVRFQIENLVRTSYVLQAPDSADLVVKLIKGERFSKIKAHDDPKQTLTDRELVKRAAIRHAWLPPVYEASNEWVHLSDRHVFNATQLKEDEDRTIVGRLPLPIEDIPVRFLAEVLGAMYQATHDLFAWLEEWEEWKAEHATDARDE